MVSSGLILELAMLDDEALMDDLGDMDSGPAEKAPAKELDLPKAEAKPVNQEAELESLMK